MKRRPWEISRAMFLNETEVLRLLAHVRAAANLTDRLIIEGLLFSGLRCSEFCRLRASDTVLGQRSSVFIVTGRGQERRTVHVPRELSRLVQVYWKSLAASGGPPRLSDSLLQNERRRPFDRTALYRRVVSILTDIGLADRASVQLLRHTYGYLAYLRTGGNLLFVQRQLGHSHPMVTSIYAQFVAESYTTLAEQVAGGSVPGSRVPRRFAGVLK